MCACALWPLLDFPPIYHTLTNTPRHLVAAQHCITTQPSHSMRLKTEENLRFADDLQSLHVCTNPVIGANSASAASSLLTSRPLSRIYHRRFWEARFSALVASFSQLHVPKLVASHAVRTTEMEARQGAAWPSAQPYRCRWFPIASARHRVCPRCSRRREELRNKHVALKHQRPPNAIMMSLIAARRQGKETEKVPPANIDSRYVSFGEHAAVRAPLSSPNC